MCTDVTTKDQAKSVRRARKIIEPTAQRRKIRKRRSRLTNWMRWRVIEFSLWALTLKAKIDADEITLELVPLNPNDTQAPCAIDKQSVNNILVNTH